MRKSNLLSTSPKFSPRKGKNKRTASSSPSSTGFAKVSTYDDKSTDVNQTPFKTKPRIQDCGAEPPRTSAPSKRALPSSLAESLRAVFAAFLWHEGK